VPVQDVFVSEIAAADDGTHVMFPLPVSVGCFTGV
jgi:hypothetical protein